MQELYNKRKRVTYIALLFTVLLLVSLIAIIISTVNFLYTPLIIWILVFTVSAYATPIFWISRIDLAYMMEILNMVSESTEVMTSADIKLRLGLKNQKYADKLINKLEKGGYFS